MDNRTNARPAFPGPAVPATPQPPAPHEGDAPLIEDPDAPVQVDRAVFLAARLRETLADAANLRNLVAELQKELATMRAGAAQAEIDRLDQDYDVGSGTVLHSRPDGTFWRIPKSVIQQQQQQQG